MRVKRIKFKTLAATMARLGLDPWDIDDRDQAINAIYNQVEKMGLPLDYECDFCGLDVPDVDFCLFCGVNLVDSEEYVENWNKKKNTPGSIYRGARRGVPAKDAITIKGTRLLARTIAVLGLPHNAVKHGKTAVSFWCYWGLFARCFVGSFSLRVHMPFAVEEFDDPADLVIPTDEQKGMQSRITIEYLEEIRYATQILKQSALLKKAAKEKAEKRARDEKTKI